MKINWTKIGIGFAATIVVMFFLLLLWRATFVTFVDNYELGFVYNAMNGKIEKLDRTGYIIRWPFVYRVHTIDLRPYQVTISANQRVLNAKLIKFNPTGLDTFIAWHGRNAGDDTGNGTINGQTINTGMLEILKCYAFDRDDGRDCPFLTVISVLQPNQGTVTNEISK